MHVLVVVNPASRRGAQSAEEGSAVLRSKGVTFETVSTEAAGHATILAREWTTRRRFDAVFSSGGDGTVTEVIAALAGTTGAPPIGILPGGTANVLARTLRIPLRPSTAAQILLDATPAHMDIGRLGDGRCFAIGLGVGLDAAMIGATSPSLKRWVGWLAYAVAATRVAARLERFDVRLSVDGVAHDLRTSSVLIANFGSVVAHRIHFGAGITHDDGLMNACVYSPRHRVDAARMLWRMLRGRVHGDRCFTGIPGKHFVIEARPPRQFQADGELLGASRIEITVEPRAVRLLVPPRAMAQ